MSRDVNWPKYTIDTEYHVNIDRKDSVGQYLHAADVTLWRKILPRIIENCGKNFPQFSKLPEETCDADGGCN